jgi:hypothetical protein
MKRKKKMPWGRRKPLKRPDLRKERPWIFLPRAWIFVPLALGFSFLRLGFSFLWFWKNFLPGSDRTRPSTPCCPKLPDPRLPPRSTAWSRRPVGSFATAAKPPTMSARVVDVRNGGLQAREQLW